MYAYSTYKTKNERNISVQIFYVSYQFIYMVERFIDSMKNSLLFSAL